MVVGCVDSDTGNTSQAVDLTDKGAVCLSRSVAKARRFSDNSPAITNDHEMSPNEASLRRRLAGGGSVRFVQIDPRVRSEFNYVTAITAAAVLRTAALLVVSP